MEIHETRVIAANHVPEGSVFKGYLEYTIQDLKIEVHNVLYRVECWRTADGKHVRGELPQEVQGSHFGTTVKSFILYQYYQQHVTHPLILEGLKEWGINMSAGQLDRILTEGKEEFHREKDRILEVGLEVSSYVNVDDTGARHRGQNGYATHIGNDLFAWFASTSSKIRINFLKLLRAGRMDYVLSEEAVEKVRSEIWKMYRELKSYKANPSLELKTKLETRFDAIFLQKTCFMSLNLALKRPEVLLHNNASERDIREYVKRRKISGGTRSDLGRQCRDTFVSLKKTCRKLEVSFWDYLRDRVFGTYAVPQLPDLILAKAIAPG